MANISKPKISDPSPQAGSLKRRRSDDELVASEKTKKSRQSSEKYEPPRTLERLKTSGSSEASLSSKSYASSEPSDSSEVSDFELDSSDLDKSDSEDSVKDSYMRSESSRRRLVFGGPSASTSDSSSSTGDNRNEESSSEDDESETNEPDVTISRSSTVGNLKARLSSFLGRMKAANDKLETERKAGTLEQRQINVVEENGRLNDVAVKPPQDTGNDGPMIEMDLGLGVLEQRDQRANAMSESEEDFLDADNESEEKETDVMGRLLGKRRSKKKAIEEVAVGS